MQPFVQKVLHPTDLSPASDVAFAYALAIAVVRKAALTILNAHKDFDHEDWTRLPRVREVLERWGLLEAGSSRADVFAKLAVKVSKVGVDASDPVEAILGFLGEHPHDLMVLATEGREGLPRFLHGSVAQQAARGSGVRALFVPEGCRGFVSLADGSLSLRRILVPVAERPDPQAAVESAAWAAEALGLPPVAIHVLHVGATLPDLDLPPGDTWTWHPMTRPGDPVEEILAVAEELPADLLVMTTDGRDGFIDVFRGSHVERVVRRAACPVATLPIPKGI